MSGRRQFQLLAVVFCLIIAGREAETGRFLGKAAAQEPAPQLFITNADAASLPEIELVAYGWDNQGQPLDLMAHNLTVTHGGQPAAVVEVAGTRPVGTFTVFIIDVPPDVADQLPAIREAIEQYASPTTMQEQVDHLAIYRVGESSAEQLLEPTGFHNSVRNLFVAPLSTQSSLTALYDSVVGLLDEIATLKPHPAMATTIVLITDGTDAISEQAVAADLPARAGNLGIPIHTVWLNNPGLSNENKEAGRNYLLDVSTATGGLATRLDTPGQLETIWSNIAAFRDQTLIRYTMADPAAGSFPVTLSLADQPETNATVTIDIPPGAPIINLVLPPESRTLRLPNLAQPVTLAFSANLRWLGDVERTPMQAQLFVNDAQVADIDVNQLGRFTADINNFNYGTNSVHVMVIDDAGDQGTSPPLLLTVEEGPRQIPAELQPGGNLLPTLNTGFPWLLCIFGLLILLLLLGLVAWWFRIRVPYLDRWRQSERFRGAGSGNVSYGPSKRGRDARDWDDAAWGGAEAGVADGSPYLEVLSAETETARIIALDEVEIRLGRSPMQADVVFEQDPTVSRLHASIVRDGYEYRLYDEQSTSGTLVNGISVPAHGVALISGDEIHLGAVHLRFNQP